MYFYGHVTTQYGELEFGQGFVVEAGSLEEAMKRVNGIDWTHGDGIEEQQEPAHIRRISQDHFVILRQYLVEV